MKIKLTKTSVANVAQPDKGQVFIWDSILPGFGLRVTPTSKTFIVQAKLPDGRDRRVTLGKPEHYPDVQALRNKARELIVKIQNGYDPKVAKQQDKKKNITLSEVLSDYLHDRNLKPVTVKDYQYHINRIFKKWADRPIKEINMEKVINLFDEQSKNAPTQTNTAFRILRSLLNYAMTAYRDADDKPLFVENPVNILTARGRWNPSHAKNGRIPINKIGAVWNLLKDHRGQPTYDCVAFILLTGCRRGEAEKLVWRNVDFENELWTIENPKNNTDRTLPLSTQAVKLLEDRQALAINEYVFSGLSGGHVVELKRVTNKISEIAGTRITPHDLRRTFVSIADTLKIDFLSVKLLLNHSIGSDVTLRHYSQTTVLDKLKPEIDMIGNWVERQGRLAASKVVDITTVGKAL